MTDKPKILETIFIFECKDACLSSRHNMFKNNNWDKIKVQVIDIILLPHEVNSEFSVKNTAYAPMRVSGNVLSGYRIRGGDDRSTYSTKEVKTASNKTAYLCKVVDVMKTNHDWMSNLIGNKYFPSHTEDFFKNELSKCHAFIISPTDLGKIQY